MVGSAIAQDVQLAYESDRISALEYLRPPACRLHSGPHRFRHLNYEMEEKPYATGGRDERHMQFIIVRNKNKCYVGC